jgi:hypothetical protein
MKSAQEVFEVFEELKRGLKRGNDDSSRETHLPRESVDL